MFPNDNICYFSKTKDASTHWKSLGNKPICPYLHQPPTIGSQITKVKFTITTHPMSKHLIHFSRKMHTQIRTTLSEITNSPLSHNSQLNFLSHI